DQSAVTAVDQAILLEPPQRLPHRRAARLAPRGQRVLDQRLAGLELAAENGLLQLLIGRLTGNLLRRVGGLGGRGDGSPASVHVVSSVRRRPQISLHSCNCMPQSQGRLNSRGKRVAGSIDGPVMLSSVLCVTFAFWIGTTVCRVRELLS